MTNHLLLAAKPYLDRKWPVFPVMGKVPLTAHGFHDASTSPEQIEKWFSNPNVTGLAIACGAANLIVLDIDVKNGGYASLEALEKQHGPIATYSVATGGGGRHYYFDANGHNFNNRANLFPGVDLRATGGYVVAPPSAHESGGAYAALNGLETLKPIPEWLVTVLKSGQGAPREFKDDSNKVGEGGRNNYLVSLAGFLRRKGVSEEALYAALEGENRATCNPPLPDHEIERIAAWAQKFEATDPIKVEGQPWDVIRIQDLIGELMTYLSDALLVKGEPTGITGLDELLGGGCRLGEVTAWHAEAKTGKNTVWHKLMHLWLKRGIPLGYASRELTPATEVLPDLLSIELQRSIRKTAITASEIQTAIQSWPLYFSSGYGAWEWEDIYEWVIALKALGVKYFWFDHLHYMIDDPEDYGQASKLIKRLKTLAKSESIYINVIIQPNKLAEGQKLSLNSIKGGAAMGQAIDNLITLERVKDQKNILRLELKAARSKMATLGERYLQYNPETIDFIEVAPTQADSQSHKILHEDY